MRKSFTYEGKRYYISGHTEEEIQEKIKQKKKEFEGSSVYTFEEWSQEFLDVYKSDLADDTLKNYEMRIRNFLIPVIGNKTLSEITPLDCQKILNKLRGYSANYIHKVYHDMHQIFQKAYFNGLINFNPIDRCEVPKGYKNSYRSLTEPERGMVLKAVESHPAKWFVLFMLYCGCRPHEAGLIQGKDVENRILHIRGDKTALADRYVPIPDVLYNILPSAEPEEYYVKSISGLAPTKKHHRTKLWNSLKETFPVETDITPYCFRHTYCTDLRDAGIPITVAKDFMGHSTIKLTADIYTHKSLRSFEESVEKINAHLDAHL